MSNLSKIRPKLRTTGNVTGNFGRPKTKAGSSLSDIGYGNVGSLPSKRQWFDTMMMVYPRLDVRWRRSMLPQLRSLAATINELPTLNLVVSSYSI